MNSLWLIFKHKLTNAVNKHAPLKEKICRGRPCPWLTKRIKDNMHLRDYNLRRAKQTNQENDWSTYERSQNFVTSLIRHAKSNCCRNILRNNTESPRDFWKNNNTIFPSKSRTSHATKMDINNGSTKDKSKISNSFCDFFTAIASKLHNTVRSIHNRTWKPFTNTCTKGKINPENTEFTFSPVDQSVINKLIKGPGPDNIPTSMIKEASDELSYPLTKLVSLSLETGSFPNEKSVQK